MNRISPLRPLSLLTPLLLTIAAACGAGSAQQDSADIAFMRQWNEEVAALERENAAPKPAPEASKPADSPAVDTRPADSGRILAQDLPDESPYTEHFKNIIEAPYDVVFNDSNKYHYKHAERLGIQPIANAGLAYFTQKPLVRIQSSDYYSVAELKHSVPYLVPQAAVLLADIGKEFNRRTGGKYSIRVTSLLRTPTSVKRLRSVNRNATDSSTHQFATTFDISYTNYLNRTTGDVEDRRGLKEALAQTLLDMRNSGRCLVKYEIKSPCFHITVRK